MSLRNFLAKAKAALAAPIAERSPLTFVVGNESADLDSLCSALVYAYLRTHTNPNTLHIPLSNLTRSDLALRTEMTAVLQAANLDPRQLLTLSDLPEHLPSEHTRWLLVDHNSLTGQLSRFNRQVTGCVDHHTDEGAVPADASPRVIEPCGSCMSLVIEETRGVWEDLAKTAEDEDVERQLAMISLAPILIDTAHFTDEAKVKPKDESAAAFLEDRLQGWQGYDRKTYFQRVADVKEDISSLSHRDVLRKDYKEWTEGSLKLGVSSVVRGLDYLAKDDPGKFLDALAAWGAEGELDLVSVMTHDARGEFKRHLLVWGRTDKGVQALQAFEDASSKKLQLETFDDGRLDGENRKAWHQGDLASSRKQVAPLLRQAMCHKL